MLEVRGQKSEDRRKIPNSISQLADHPSRTSPAVRIVEHNTITHNLTQSQNDYAVSAGVFLITPAATMKPLIGFKKKSHFP